MLSTQHKRFRNGLLSASVVATALAAPGAAAVPGAHGPAGASVVHETEAANAQHPGLTIEHQGPRGSVDFDRPGHPHNYEGIVGGRVGRL